MIRSPYNFVPAPTEAQVFKPEWADQVSHDIPFEDGESGEIDIEITAETPIFIRNGHSKPKDGDKPTSEFSHYIDDKGEKQYFIPATSIKGMLRNVLEIMSFSRMRQVEDNRHAVRQIMKQGAIDEGYELSQDEKKNIECGWLIEREGKMFIHSCGKPLKIRYTDLDQKFKKDFANQFGGNLISNMQEDFSARTGAYKYELLGTHNLEANFIIHPLNEDDKQKSWVSTFQPLLYVKFGVEDVDENLFKGSIVCVGQASNYEVSTSRRGEYVFKGIRKDILDKVKGMEVKKDVYKTFLFINRDNQKKEELEDWSFWKTKINDGIPVFFRKNNKNEIIDFGLTFMYKQPVKNSVGELLNYKSTDEKSFKSDLANLIFGFVKSNNNSVSSTKGRVMISNFRLQSEPKFCEPLTYSLSSPKSSFVPFYLKQTGNNGTTTSFNTYNKSSQVNGFKKYPVRNTAVNKDFSGFNQDMLQTAIPIDSKSVYLGKIRFHNLRKMEIGALLSSINLHNSENTYHNLGSLKPFGYGRVKIEVKSSNCLMYNQTAYLKEFETFMKAHADNWIDVMKELIAVATVSPAAESSLEYMELGDFQVAKNTGKYLRPYSEISNFILSMEPTVNNEEINRRKNDLKNIIKSHEEKVENAANNFNKLLKDKNIDLAKRALSHLKVLDTTCDYADQEDIIKSQEQEIKESIEIEVKINKCIEAKDIEALEALLNINQNLYNFQTYNQELIKLKDERRQERAQNAAANVIDFSTIDMSQNYRNIESAIEKIVNSKALLVHQVNNISKINSIYFSSSKDITNIFNVLVAFVEKLSDSEKSESKMQPRLVKYTKWIGPEKAQELYNQLFSNK